MKNRLLIARSLKRALGTAALSMALGLWASGGAMAGMITVVKQAGCTMAGPPCITSDAPSGTTRFVVLVGQTVMWEANYLGSGLQGNDFYISQNWPGTASTALSTSLSSGYNSGTIYLAAGIYYVSANLAVMGPGAYSLEAPGLYGDTHIMTTNGVNYDFQGAGEFVVARDASGFEFQTRMAPVATVNQPGVDPYSGLTACVSINTAVAARVGGHRVTYQPNISGVPDPSGLQLRVDGQLVTLGPIGIDLGSGVWILPTADAGGLAINSESFSVIVTPHWWANQNQWYLSITLSPPPESRGLVGHIATNAWLPLLPDGTSLGPRPVSLHERYVQLYQTFSDAWRVTDGTTLFDYGPGASTQAFSVQSWPPEQPPCHLPGVVPVAGATQQDAELACQAVMGPTDHRNCVFDVMATGDGGFARAYRPTEVLQRPRRRRSESSGRRAPRGMRASERRGVEGLLPRRLRRG